MVGSSLINDLIIVNMTIGSTTSTFKLITVGNGYSFITPTRVVGFSTQYYYIFGSISNYFGTSFSNNLGFQWYNPQIMTYCIHTYYTLLTLTQDSLPTYSFANQVSDYSKMHINPTLLLSILYF